MVAVIRGFRAKSVFILLACGVRISTWTFKPAQAAECRRAIVYRSSLCPVPQQFHDDIALLILLSDVQCCLSCSVPGIYVLTVPQQPSNQKPVADAAGEVEDRIPVVFSMYHW
jgi:hypothetical protein